VTDWPSQTVLKTVHELFMNSVCQKKFGKQITLPNFIRQFLGST
jgi:hypothetical protein